jgi:hypothetical protein
MDSWYILHTLMNFGRMAEMGDQFDADHVAICLCLKKKFILRYQQ